MPSAKLPLIRAQRGAWYQWICLAAVSLPFAWWGSTHRLAGKQRMVAVRQTAERATDLDAFVFAYRARQMYGCGPEELDPVQLMNVKRSWQCDRAIDKFAAHGLDSLTDDECEGLVRLLPRQYPNLEEYPGFKRILRVCRERLERAQRVESTRAGDATAG
ncbi:MAG TPA: hypothetical protein VGX78_01010 [Pirellulales bacterium]|jgi:hypothetical protein|nr:hypothetical protein [Pirellulales bacterium]